MDAFTGAVGTGAHPAQGETGKGAHDESRVWCLQCRGMAWGIAEGKGGEVPFPTVAERLPDSQRRCISSEPLGRQTSAEEGQSGRNATSLPLCTREG